MASFFVWQAALANWIDWAVCARLRLSQWKCSMLDLVKAVANNWFTWWMVGLLMSFRMIVPAKEFLSERSAKWLAQRLTTAPGVSTRRRFDVSFKRYVDRTFAARQVRIGGCRVWVLRYRKTALVSLFTFLIIYVLLLATVDFAQLRLGVEDIRAGFQDPDRTDFDANRANAVALIAEMDATYILAVMLIFYGVAFALFNTLTDYLSFLETRNVLARLGRGPVRDIIWVVVDFVLTTAISLVGFVFMWLLVTYAGTLISGHSPGFAAVASEGMQIGLTALQNAVAMVGDNRPALSPTDPSMIAMTLSTYATSIWIWVFFGSTLAIRCVVLVRPLLRLVTFLIDVDDHPFRAAWLMFAIIWTAGLGLYALV